MCKITEDVLKGAIKHYPWLAKFLMLIGLFILSESLFSLIGLYLAELLVPASHILDNIGSINNGLALEPDTPMVHALEVYQFCTSLGRFGLLTFAFLWLIGESAGSFLQLRKSPSLQQLIWVFPLMISAAVVIGAVNEWNQGLTLPETLSGLEKQMRQMEEQAKGMTDAFLGTTTIGGLLINIFLIGIVAAVTEELFFRGLVQGIFHRWTGKAHAGIWIAAFLFSFIHMQFYGFFPRLLLGALLGYICYWSGSLWTAMAGHFINNTAAVILYFLVSNGSVEQDPTETGTWAQALVFLPVLAIFIWQFRRHGARLDDGV